MPTADQIAAAALELGFARVGFCPVERFDDAEQRLETWLAQGYHGDMGYLAGPGRGDPRALLAEARTLIVVAMAYPAAPIGVRAGKDGPALAGTVARYARGTDYHQVMKPRLRRLADRVSEIVERPVLARTCVDTAPLLERAAAERAGIGFSAKSTLTLAPGLGTYILLGELLVDVELEPSRPIDPGCGSCRACLDACPTGAFVDAHVLDARRCISYLTIEHQGPIPRELRRAIGTRVFGCDVCQEVCPYNAGSSKPAAPELDGPAEVDLVAWLEVGSAGYRKLVKRRAWRRASRETLARNAAIALGNSHDPRAVPPLCRALAGHPSAVVRAHAAWALGELGGPEARAALVEAARADGDGSVREEAAAALESFTSEDRDRRVK
jgi:epoxyqueuosine reductase